MRVKSENFTVSTDDLGTVIITDLSDKNYPDKYFVDSSMLDELIILLEIFQQKKRGG